MSSLEIRDLWGGYGDVTVLKGVSLTVQLGQVVALVGANGVGKSTLLRTISGLIRPDAGQIRVLGRDVVAEPQRARRRVAKPLLCGAQRLGNVRRGV